MALAAVTVVALGTLALVAALGDQRHLSVVLSSPSEGDTVPLTLRQLSITFNTEPDHGSVEHHLKFDPPAAGATRWRGKTLVYTFDGPLGVGDHHFTLEQGASGRAAERLEHAFGVAFTVRQPGVLVVQADGAKRNLVAERGDKQDTLITADNIADFAVSPDGASVAVVSENNGLTTLSLISSVSGEIRPLVRSPGIDLGGVSWAADASALLVVRRDRLPSGDEGVPRTWLARLSGEFVGPIDASGSPSISPTWSPDGQSVAYIAPAEGKLAVLNLSTHAVLDLGQPRGAPLAWSPDSKLVAFESVPPVGFTGSGLLQPIRVHSVDGKVDRFLGLAGEARSAPAFLDADTLMDIRWTVGNPARGTELLFESLKTGQVARSVQLATGSDSVTGWELDPLGRHIVYSLRSGPSLRTIDLDLDSGTRTTLPVAGTDPRWLP